MDLARLTVMFYPLKLLNSGIPEDMFKMRPEISLFTMPPIFSLPLEAYFICVLLGFFLSFLFYMDQNITSAIVNNPQNKWV